jgi:DNA-binding IclR family transcriptional regulator
MIRTVPQLGKTGVGGAQAISRSVHVLRTIAQLQRSGATAVRVAHATGLSRPTVYRMLRALEAERMVERRDDEPNYWLGPLAYELGLAARPAAPPQSRWQAAVELVAMRTRLTSYLIGRSGDEAVCLICIQGAAAIRAMPVEVGQRVPLGIGAGSLAILASLPDDEIDRIIANLSKPARVFLGGAETRDHLIGRIHRVRDAGFSVSSGTVAKGLSGVGVLIPGTSDEHRLALTVSAVAQDMAEVEARKLAEVLINAIRSM